MSDRMIVKVLVAVGAILHLLLFFSVFAPDEMDAMSFFVSGLFVWWLFGPLALIARREAQAAERRAVVIRRGHWTGYPGRP